MIPTRKTGRERPGKGPTRKRGVWATQIRLPTLRPGHPPSSKCSEPLSLVHLPFMQLHFYIYLTGPWLSG